MYIYIYIIVFFGIRVSGFENLLKLSREYYGKIRRILWFVLHVDKYYKLIKYVYV